MFERDQELSNTNQSYDQSLYSVDLSQEEAKLLESNDTDLTETKEALVDALLNLTEARCRGDGEFGDYIYGAKPSSKLVSGFLLPRFDHTGVRDETSNTHIAIMGVDFQISDKNSDEIIIEPKFSIYIRVLPSWNDISNPKFDMYPRIMLSNKTRNAINQRAKEIIEKELKKIAPVEEEKNLENEGENISNARKSIQIKENIELNNQEPVTETGEKGEKFVSELEIKIKKIEKKQSLRNDLRRKHNDEISEIRRNAYDIALNELGITLHTDDISKSRSTKIEDFNEEDEREIVKMDESESSQQFSASDNDNEIDNSSDSIQPEIGGNGALRRDVGQLDDKHAAPQSIPMKWKRISLDLGKFKINSKNENSIIEAKAKFNSSLRQKMDSILATWLETDEGKSQAYRPNERILPSQFSNESNWENYLNDLRNRKSANLADIRPKIDNVELIIEIYQDLIDPTRKNVRVAIENGAENIVGPNSSEFEHSIFNVDLTVYVPREIHKPLRLNRIPSSHNYMDWLDYPAMGLNCGISELESKTEVIKLKTNNSPRFIQPRTEPREVKNVITSYAKLASNDTDVCQLNALPDAYDDWISKQLKLTNEVANSNFNDADHKIQKPDFDEHKKESGYIRVGISILDESRQAYLKLSKSNSLTNEEEKRLMLLSIPWRSWIFTNETFKIYGGDQYTDWRLFQLAFILAHIPTLASRMTEFERFFDMDRDENSASLLYFPTGGGKSEAFFGLLIFNLFFDRLRGKNRGVTAFIRYPLRLLTLQQARRLIKIIVQAEMIRKKNNIGTWPFEVGFWVGSGNTPNRINQGFGAVPSIKIEKYNDDTLLLNPSDDKTDEASKARRKSELYIETLEAFDKLRTCPSCGSTTGMRKFPNQHDRIGIVCFEESCDWNQSHSNSEYWEPLPFILTDDTIYQRAPSIILGTVDKLALIGQHDRTINSIVGMFGCARYLDPKSKHLFVPRGEKSILSAATSDYEPIYPAFPNGKKVFHDPFPSLIIQDEGHLLTESLGTFSGLFETTLESLFHNLGNGILNEIVSWRKSVSKKSSNIPRLAKVIAATATISDPDRQLDVLYQRESLRFPSPGVNLYESFFSVPVTPQHVDRQNFSKSLPEHKQPEFSSPWMRIYKSVMTNGHSHAEATSAIISAYHLNYTLLWNQLLAGNTREVIETLISSLTPHDPLSKFRKEALLKLLENENVKNLLASLLELQKISLTYVTSKKVGDLIIDTLRAKVESDQRSENLTELHFNSDLISGGVTIAEIQDIMTRAEGNIEIGNAFSDIGESTRNIVATSAISHGVDVENFNAMFFVGLPSDISEYIQASSRIGRIHPGFCILIPTPYSRRDRYVLETHDQFHRFLESMISPPAVQRWADRAIRRVIPSVIQTYLCGIKEQEQFFTCGENGKHHAKSITSAAAIKSWVDSHNGGFKGAVEEIVKFAINAIGIDGRGKINKGKATFGLHYKNFVEDCITEIIEIIVQRTDTSKLSNYWKSIETDEIQCPMTSLRDIDAGGIIHSASRDPFRNKKLNFEAVRQVMKVIRGQRMAVHSELDAEFEPLDIND